MAISLSQSRAIIEGALAEGRVLDLKPLSVVVLDPRAAMVAMMSEDGVSQMRARIAHGKANAAIALGMGTRALMNRADLQAIIDHYATFKVPQASGDRSCPHYKPRNSSEPSVNITRANLTSGGKWVGPWCD